ncbi:MAG: hypothetical protein FWF36_07425 [Propionibacteriaceae bacterium]|nr:hypothetical protein [Propionibacteriaceae bacterium]
MLRSEWEQLPTEMKAGYCQGIESRVERAAFQQLVCFEGLETAVFIVDGEEFAFVPADEAVIGYDPSAPIPQVFLDLLTYEWCDVLGQDDVRKELRRVLSPRRRGQCREMLVERYMSEVWWEKGGLGLPISGGITMPLDEGGSDFDVVRRIVDTLRPLGWDILTEDEWEYLAGGICPTILSPHLMGLLAKDPKTVKSNSICADASRGTRWDPGPGGRLSPAENWSKLNVLNSFGLWLNQGGPNEVVNAECLMKNGDGACASCGGYEAFDAVVASPHYRYAPPRSEFVVPMEYFCLRRVIPLGSA